ncbi:hypothetical protein D0620_23720 [Salmonella enterica]|nr:hypothetical protein [Salmonella enterica]
MSIFKAPFKRGLKQRYSVGFYPFRASLKSFRLKNDAIFCRKNHFDAGGEMPGSPAMKGLVWFLPG